MAKKKWREARERILRKYRFGVATQSQTYNPYLNGYYLEAVLNRRHIDNDPGSVLCGQSFGIVVTARRPDGSVKTDYRGTVTVSPAQSQRADMFDPPYTYTETDGGRHTFWAAVFTIVGTNPVRQIRAVDDRDVSTTLDVKLWFQVLSTTFTADPGSPRECCALPSTAALNNRVYIAAHQNDELLETTVGECGPWYAPDADVCPCRRFNEPYWTDYNLSVNSLRESYRERKFGVPLAVYDKSNHYPGNDGRDCIYGRPAGLDITHGVWLLLNVDHTGPWDQWSANLYWRFDSTQ
jgi:hypothetical protein